MSPRVYTRKLDWTRAAELHQLGLTYEEIGRRYGVSGQAVALAIHPERRARYEAYSKKWQRTGICDDCGGPMNRASRSQGHSRCQRCAAARAATSVREDTLRCFMCRDWKPDDEFPKGGIRSESNPRRGRHSQCRGCNTIARREYRERSRRPCAAGCGTPVTNEAKTGMCKSCAGKARVERERREKNVLV